MTLNDLIRTAAEEVPEGWEIILQIEKGKIRAGTVNPSRVWKNATNQTDPNRDITIDLATAFKDTQLDRT